MDNYKNDKYYLNKIITDLTFVVKHTNNIDLESLEKDEVLTDCIMFRLVQVSENANKLTDGFKKYYYDIPWVSIKGMRNRIVHQYGSVDVSIVYDTVINDIPKLLCEFNKIFYDI